MSELKIGIPGGADFLQPPGTTGPWTNAQVPVALGASGTFAVANNIATLTFTSAHGLTMVPTYPAMPNFFVQFNGASAITGTGTINGPIFRILSIPNTTSLTIYTTVTAATVTSANAVPVFFPPFSPIIGSTFVGFLNNLGTNVVGALVQSSSVNFSLGANCTIQFDPTNVQIIYDGTTGNTPSTVPTLRSMAAVSTNGQEYINPPQMGVYASGSAGTSYFSVIE